jgi:hypothetical protein
MKIIPILLWICLPIIILENQVSSESVVRIQIHDESSVPLNNVQIIIKQRGTVLYTLFTQSNGKLTLDLANEFYNISISKSGFKTIVDQELVINKSSHEFVFTLQRKISTHPPGDKKQEKLKSSFERLSMAETSFESSYNSDLPKSGQMTAAEWNDLHNWQLWEELLDQKEYSDMEDFWGINTQNRYSITILNNEDIPISNVAVDLLDNENQTVWTGISDLSGKVELWDNAFDQKSNARKAKAYHGGKSYEIAELYTLSQGSNIIKIAASCHENINVDISFVVDATSSMKDEIKYLQSELIDVIEKVQSSDKTIRWSSLFYRDHDEEYLTRKSDFSEDKNKVLQFIESQSADGGGDYPEEVAEAVNTAVHGLSWDNNAQTKLLFLILDAPPHDNQLSLDKYRNAVKAAASMGIKIIPITASGINRYTEFLMKFSAILTNGTYIFITDDSGIGNGHLDPVVQDYKVETLNEILIRLIYNYCTIVPCNGPIEQLSWEGRVYPNPAADFLNIDQVTSGDLLQIISSSGMVIKSYVVQNENTARMEVSNLTPGSYFIQIIRSDGVITKPVLIIR